MKEPLEEAQAGEKIRWARVSGNHLGSVDGFRQVNGKHKFGSHWAGWVGEGSTNKQWCLLHLSTERIAPTPTPPALSLKLVNFVTSCMSLGLFELLPLPLTLDLVNFWVSLCTVPFRTLPCSPVPSVFLWCNPHHSSQLNIMGTSLPWSGSLG